MASIFNFSYKRRGGLRFVKLGRFGFSFYVSRAYRPMKMVREAQRHAVTYIG